MQNLKRVLSLVLVIAMVASFMLTASAKTAEQLTDLSDSKYQPEVRVLNALDIVEGYEDGTYKPANEVTRAELALILARVRVGGDKEMIRTYNYGHMTYTDILKDGYVWAASGIQYCTDNGMVIGDGNGKYRPGDTVTIVEALKMLLTALGYDAEIESLQNVGAAWKANTLSLAKEVGLMDRFYGDTNRNCTRDDIALLIYNFLNSKIVKGYYQTDVANVNTRMYNNTRSTALEAYFDKQIVYGAIIANEKANLDIFGPAANLEKGYTELFLYTLADEKQIALADTTKSDDYVITIKGLSTDLGDIGESVFVITDLAPSKGYYSAVGGVCFPTGENTVGTKTWKNTASLGKLVNNKTLYFVDYDPADYNTCMSNDYDSTGTGNGNFLKTVDYNGDGKLDLVMQERWKMTRAAGANRAGVAKIDGTDWASAARDADSVITGYINYHTADGIFYSVAAETIAKTALASGTDAVNYAKGYITLADGNKYEQSKIGGKLGLEKLGLNTIIMDCLADPKATQNYNWYLDCGGYIRAYGEDNSQYNTLYLLTDASSKLNGRKYEKGVTVYQQSNEAENYSVAANCYYVDSLPNASFDAQVSFNGFVTNLVYGAAAESSITLRTPAEKPQTNLIEINPTTGKYASTEYVAADGKTVYATTLTDYYIVKIAYDTINKTNYVAKVEYVQGYANAEFNAENCNFYANVKDATVKGIDGTYKYAYEATTIVVESKDPTVYTEVPAFVYKHVSASYDNYWGIFNVVDDAGSIDANIYVKENNAVYPPRAEAAKGGFYLYNEAKKSATLIEEDFNDYGIYADILALDLSNRDYVVLDSGKHFSIVDVPVYAIYGGAAWSVAEYTGLKAGDQIIYYTENGKTLKYILVVTQATTDLPSGKKWDDDAIKLWGYINNGTYPVTPKSVLFANAVDAFDAATAAWLNAAQADKAAAYDAMVAAFFTAYGYTDDIEQNAFMSDVFYNIANRNAKNAQIQGESAVINAAINNGTYMDSFMLETNKLMGELWGFSVMCYKDADGNIVLEQYKAAKTAYDTFCESDIEVLVWLDADLTAYTEFPPLPTDIYAAKDTLTNKYLAYKNAIAFGGSKADALNELTAAYAVWTTNYPKYTFAELPTIAAVFAN